MQDKKCYNCRKPIKGKAIMCKECQGKPVKATSTLIIFDKV